MGELRDFQKVYRAAIYAIQKSRSVWAELDPDNPFLDDPGAVAMLVKLSGRTNPTPMDAVNAATWIKLNDRYFAMFMIRLIEYKLPVGEIESNVVEFLGHDIAEWSEMENEHHE